MRRATVDLFNTFNYRTISIHALREESDIGVFEMSLNGLSDFNPRSPWGERLLIFCQYYDILIYFNPRSPWGERQAHRVGNHCFWVISIHALREESDKLSAFYLTNFSQFQSTLSVRRATSLYVSFVKPQTDFNPRSPWGERHDNKSIAKWLIEFQSTLSVRRATAKSNIIFTLKSTIYLHFFTKL